MMNIHDFEQFKHQGRKISMVTCYDFWSAKILNESDVDCLLVGDSLAMTVQGHANTLPVFQCGRCADSPLSKIPAPG